MKTVEAYLFSFYEPVKFGFVAVKVNSDMVTSNTFFIWLNLPHISAVSLATQGM